MFFDLCVLARRGGTIPFLLAHTCVLDYDRSSWYIQILVQIKFLALSFSSMFGQVLGGTVVRCLRAGDDRGREATHTKNTHMQTRMREQTNKNNQTTNKQTNTPPAQRETHARLACVIVSYRCSHQRGKYLLAAMVIFVFVQTGWYGVQGGECEKEGAYVRTACCILTRL